MVYPACAGIDPSLMSTARMCVGLPRMRGDRPPHRSHHHQADPFTPHARGSTWVDTILIFIYTVYPACAGIDPLGGYQDYRQPSLPRMRGDRPCLLPSPAPRKKFTPHARGSTPIFQNSIGSANVYPACAGIDLSLYLFSLFFLCLPRMRGDRPLFPNFWTYVHRFTPHARGSTVYSPLNSLNLIVYPACAGIDRFQ